MPYLEVGNIKGEVNPRTDSQNEIVESEGFWGDVLWYYGTGWSYKNVEVDSLIFLQKKNTD